MPWSRSDMTFGESWRSMQGQYWAYTLLLPTTNSSEPPLGVRRRWRRRMDEGNFDGPFVRLEHAVNLAPTIEEQEVVLPRHLVDTILERAAGLAVPASIRQKAFGTDGESYMLFFGSLFVTTRFEW